ncbi:MAG TPA: MT-A70 family methyltransferase [Stellaceae bacterium]|nr:MT-A70 family methyltransferase [Stellaceae bacterium]
MAGRPPLRKKGAFTRAEIQRRYRVRQKRNNPDPQTRAKQAQRAARERALAERTMAASRDLHTGKLYGVVLADPPWRFAVRSRETGLGRAAENHYPTMNLDDIAALPVPASADCVLFLWATIPLLPAALAVMTAWGFAYKSHMAWIKDKPGTGYWFRAQHELLLLGTRGEIPAPAPGQQWPSVIIAPRAEHSVKPGAVYEMIEQQWPTMPKLEMFARQARPGWDSHGNEAGGA